MGCMSPPRFPPDPARLVGWLALEDAEVYQLSLLLCPLESLSPWYLRMAKLLLAAGSGGPASCDPDLVQLPVGPHGHGASQKCFPVVAMHATWRGYNKLLCFHLEHSFNQKSGWQINLSPE